MSGLFGKAGLSAQLAAMRPAYLNDLYAGRQPVRRPDTMTSYTPTIPERVQNAAIKAMLAAGAKKSNAQYWGSRARDAVDWVPGIGDAAGIEEGLRLGRAGAEQGDGYKRVMGVGLATMAALPLPAPMDKAGRRLFRGIPKGVDPFKVHDRGPMGKGVYLTAQPENARVYGEQVIEADAAGDLFDGVRGYLDEAAEAKIIANMTPEELARYQRWNRPKYNSDFVDMVSRSAEADRIPEIFGRAGYSGIESNIDGHEAVIFDPGNLRFVGNYGGRK